MQGSLETTGFRLPLRSADVPISSSTEAGRQLVGGMIREPRQYVGKPGVRIPLQTLMNQTRKAREPAAHIGMAGRTYVAGYGNHRRSSTSSTRASASGSTCASTRMRRRLPRSISINPIRAVATDRTRLSSSGKSFAVSSTASAAAICTGAKRGPTCSIVRACRRQVNTTLAERASSDDLKARLKVSCFAKYPRQTRRCPPDAYSVSLSILFQSHPSRGNNSVLKSRSFPLYAASKAPRDTSGSKKKPPAVTCRGFF